jgi:hypothetical protein
LRPRGLEVNHAVFIRELVDCTGVGVVRFFVNIVSALVRSRAMFLLWTLEKNSEYHYNSLM